MTDKVARTKSKVPCVLCLRKLGFGMTRITCRLRIGKASCSRIFKANGIAINPQRNGVALKGTGYRRRVKVGNILTSMRWRVRRCLDKQPPKPKAITHGMTKAQRERYLYHNDIGHRLVCLLRRRIRKVIETGVKRGSSLELLGCSTEEFRRHLENQFELGMSWSNQGAWELDHIKPCASFDLTKPSHQQRCFHFTNYRPLWSLDNRRRPKLKRGPPGRGAG